MPTTNISLTDPIVCKQYPGKPTFFSRTCASRYAKAHGEKDTFTVTADIDTGAHDMSQTPCATCETGRRYYEAFPEEVSPKKRDSGIVIGRPKWKEPGVSKTLEEFHTRLKRMDMEMDYKIAQGSGPNPMTLENVSAALAPPCKNHPDRPQAFFRRKDGREQYSGLCLECMKENAMKGHKAKKRQRLKGEKAIEALRQIAEILEGVLG